MTNWTCKDDVLRAVSLDGHALENASEALRGDKDVVLAAVKQKGWALEYASPPSVMTLKWCWPPLR